MKVFIIAGVGDHTKYIKQRTKNWERKYGLEPVALTFGWCGEYTANYSKLKHAIEDISEGQMVGVIGISAGGSAAIRLASELNNVSKIVTICARTSRGGFKIVSLKSFPAYWKSVDAFTDVNTGKEILVIRPLFDEVVSVKHMGYKNARVVNTKHVLHIPSILRILSTQSDTITEFIKR